MTESPVRKCAWLRIYPSLLYSVVKLAPDHDGRLLLADNALIATLDEGLEDATFSAQPRFTRSPVFTPGLDSLALTLSRY